ncbi:MAG: hypothetical protein R3F19_01505 [Verrucomicrobiales bacterium]
MNTPTTIRHLSTFSLKNALTAAILATVSLLSITNEASALCEAESASHEEALRVRDGAEEALRVATSRLITARLINARMGRLGAVDLAPLESNVAAAQSAMDRAEESAAETAEILKGCEAEPEPVYSANCDDERKAHEAARANVERAQAANRMAEAALARIQRLVEAGATSVRELEEARRQQAMTRAELEQAESRAVSAASTLEGCESQSQEEPPPGADVPLTIALLPSIEGVSLLITSSGNVGHTYQLQKSVDSIRWENLDAMVSPQQADQQMAWTLVSSEESYRYLRQLEEINRTRYSAGPVVINDGGSIEFYRIAVDETKGEVIENPGEAIDKEATAYTEEAEAVATAE